MPGALAALPPECQARTATCMSHAMSHSFKPPGVPMHVACRRAENNARTLISCPLEVLALVGTGQGTCRIR